MRGPRLVVAVTIAVALAGCAGSFWAAGPGGSGVKRKSPDKVVITHRVGTYGYGYYVPGAIHAGGAGVGVSLGTKLGATLAGFAARDRVVGIGSEPHFDLVVVPPSDRWSLTATLGWVFQSLWYDDDAVAYNGFTPSLSYHQGITRRFYAHLGAGYSFGKLKVADEPSADGMTTGAGELRGLGGLSWVFRRTPSIDIVLRVEVNAYRTAEVTLGPETGRLSGVGMTVQGIWSTF